MKYSFGEQMLIVLIKFLLKLFNCETVNYLRWERIPNIHDSIKEKVLCFVRSKTFINDMLRACEIGNYIVFYVIKTVENFKCLN